MRVLQNPCSRQLLLALAGALSTSGSAHAQSSNPAASEVVRQVDHILISSSAPEQIFRLLSEKFRLPVAWPFQSYGTFASGGVSLGNVNLEVIRSDAPLGSARNQAQGARGGLIAFALEPSSVSEVVAVLDARGLKHEIPAPFYQKDSSGREQLVWTTIDTSLPPARAVFFCKYNFDDVAAYRAHLRQTLKNRAGGPLGVESATELVLGVRDTTAAHLDWQRLLGRSPIQGTSWELGSGPAIRLVAARDEGLVTLRLKVRSLAVARTFLKSENLLDVDTAHEISLRRSVVGGADIRLLE